MQLLRRSSITRDVGRATAYVRRHGPRRTLRHLQYHIVNRYHDLRLGVDTAGMVAYGSVGIERPDSSDCVAIGYRPLFAALDLVPDPRGRTFLDLGAGKGRAIVAAATLPFERVIGVELLAQLAASAEANAASMHHRRARRIDVIQADAAEFLVPDTVDVIFLFNPFGGRDLLQVVNNIELSYARNPREMDVLYFNDGEFERIVRDANWLVKIRRGRCYPNISFGHYVARPPE